MIRLKSYVAFAIFTLFLTACGSNPQSYIKGKSSPIVNVEAQVENQVDITARSESLSVKNQTNQPLNLSYKLFWYDKNGVTQTGSSPESNTPWLNLWLAPQQVQNILLQKPTDESTNYRFYLRGVR